MSPQLLAACTGATLARAEVYASFLSAGMAFDNITTPMRQAMFLANLGHESLRLARTTESLDYRATALISKFGRHRISIDDANKYGRIEGKQKANQEAIANCLYGGEWGKANLGNTQPGDGWKFIGHGLIHNTGRANARAAREQLHAEPAFELAHGVTERRRRHAQARCRAGEAAFVRHRRERGEAAPVFPVHC